MLFQEDLVKPVITPRFAITCSTSLLKELGTLSAKYDLHIQVRGQEAVQPFVFKEGFTFSYN